jgi:hypothetical protein
MNYHMFSINEIEPPNETDSLKDQFTDKNEKKSCIYHIGESLFYFNKCLELWIKNWWNVKKI